MKDWWWGGFFVGLGLGLAFASWLAYFLEGTHNSAAIEHGAARWVIVDEKTGETEFRWLDELGVEDNGETE